MQDKTKLNRFPHPFGYQCDSISSFLSKDVTLEKVESSSPLDI